MDTRAPGNVTPWIHVRREPFEHGLIPIKSFAHSEGVDTLRRIRQDLSAAASPSPAAHSLNTTLNKEPRVTGDSIAACLGISHSHASLLLDTLASVLPDSGADVAAAASVNVDPLALAPVSQVPFVGANVDSLIVLLFLQNYRKSTARPQLTSSAMADVWPAGPSPFDNFPLSSTSPNQLSKTSPGRQRFVPAQLEEEAHSLAFVQKHLSALLSLLADQPGEGKEQMSPVISAVKLDALSLLLRVPGGQRLSLATPFFPPSPPGTSPPPVSTLLLHEWLLHHICAASEHMEGGRGGSVSPVPSPNAGMGDLSMVDRAKEVLSGVMTCIDGVTKMSVLKSEADVQGGMLRVSHCHDSVLYILAPLKYVTVVGCSDSILVLGAVGKSVKVESCERVQLIAATARIRISNCRECTFYLGTNQSPVVTGDNHNLQVAPYNTFYPKLESHLSCCGVDPSVNAWDRPVALAAADPHDGISHPAGNADVAAQAPTLLPPEKFAPFVVPFRGYPENPDSVTRGNPFPLPRSYLACVQQKTKAVEALRQTLKVAVLEDSRKKELTAVIQAHFKEWLLASGNIRQVYDLARLDKEP